MSEETTAEERSFNDAELEDIMNEIEDLEKEFIDPAPAAPVEAVAEAAPEPGPSPVEVEAPQATQESPVAEEVSLGEQIDHELDAALDASLEELENEGDCIEEELRAMADLEIPPVEEEVKVETVAETQQEEVKATATESEPVQESINAKEGPVSESKVVPIANTVPSSDLATEMSFNVAGHMSLKLHLNVGGEEIHLVVSPEKGLEVQMAHGAAVTLPLANQIAAQLKKAS